MPVCALSNFEEDPNQKTDPCALCDEEKSRIKQRGCPIQGDAPFPHRLALSRHCKHLRRRTRAIKAQVWRESVANSGREGDVTVTGNTAALTERLRANQR